jgi:hypothetical protein
MIALPLAIVTAAYGIWYGLLAKEFRAVHPWTGRTKYRYKPRPYLRAIVVVSSLAALIAGLAELIRIWKSS